MTRWDKRIGEVLKPVTAIALLGLFVAVILALVGMLLHAYERISDLQSEVHRLERDVIALQTTIQDLRLDNLALKARVKYLEDVLGGNHGGRPSTGPSPLVNATPWEDYTGSYERQFYVLDENLRPISAAYVRSDKTGDQHVTEQGGITSPFWMTSGEKFLIGKDTYETQEVTVDIEALKRESKIITILLRRQNHD